MGSIPTPSHRPARTRRARPTRRAAGRARATAAFTLIELLVVIAIIGILASVLFIGIKSVFGRSDETKTATLLTSIKAGLSQFDDHNHFYPGGNLSRFSTQLGTSSVYDPNDFNQGIEVVVLALRGRRFPGGPYLSQDLFDGSRGNTDNADSGESLSVNLTDTEGNLLLWELTDAWGNPLFYANVAEDLGPNASGTRQIMKKDGTIEEVDLAVLRTNLMDPETGVLVTKGYVLYSFGPDGINDYGRRDDIISWPKKLQDE
jgi:prepilin-type N-terminal cleavage/methylation domain-containing protein